MGIVAKGFKSIFSSIFGDTPKPPKPPPPPPTTPTRADASIITGGNQNNLGLQSLITTGGQGLARKANTAKRSLIGGA